MHIYSNDAFTVGRLIAKPTINWLVESRAVHVGFSDLQENLLENYIEASIMLE